MKSIIYLPAHSPEGEKRGNTSWVRCNSCSNWFHATSELIENNEIKLHCPSCQNQFLPREARNIVLA